jgi:hypothetical protein
MGRRPGLWCRKALAAGGAALLLLPAADARAFTFFSCGRNCAPRWPSGEIRLSANREVSDCDLGAMDRSIRRWNAALARGGARVRIVLSGRNPTYGLRKDGVNTVSLLVRRWPQRRGLYGWTSTWWSRGRIVEGDIIFNLEEHRFRCDIATRRFGTASLEQEMMHELGHLLGLDHAPTGIMRSEGYGNTVDADALEGLRALYGR